MTVYPARPGGAVLSKHIIQKENPVLNYSVIQCDVSSQNDSHRQGDETQKRLSHIKGYLLCFNDNCG